MYRDSDVDESESIHKRPNFDYLNILIKVIEAQYASSPGHFGMRTWSGHTDRRTEENKLTSEFRFR